MSRYEHLLKNLELISERYRKSDISKQDLNLQTLSKLFEQQKQIESYEITPFNNQDGIGMIMKGKTNDTDVAIKCLRIQDFELIKHEVYQLIEETVIPQACDKNQIYRDGSRYIGESSVNFQNMVSLIQNQSQYNIIEQERNNTVDNQKPILDQLLEFILMRLQISSKNEIQFQESYKLKQDWSIRRIKSKLSFKKMQQNLKFHSLPH
ncbi:hypothetical protein ABPG74_007924 [Tetrahymena malaccensis]